MPAAQLESDASQLLHDLAWDITEEYDAIMEGAHDMRRKFASIADQARRLRAELKAKEDEIDFLTCRHQQELSDHQMSAETTRSQLQKQGQTLKQHKSENQKLRRRNQQLMRDLDAAHGVLDQVDHLRCDICRVNIKNAMTKCGHCFCKKCLMLWMRTPSKTCPTCRGTLYVGDIQDIYLESDSTGSAILDDDAVTEIVSVSSTDD